MDQPNTNGHFIFSEISSTNDLLAAFRLRYNVYRNSRLRDFCRPNSDNLDVDPWDFYARHFGLFDLRGHQVGNVRIVTTTKQATASRIIEALGENHAPIYQARFFDRPAVLPMIAYSSEGPQCRAVVDRFIAKGHTVVESTRFALNDVGRKARLTMHLSATVIAIGFFGEWAVDVAFTTCSTPHKRFYGGFGFDNLPGTTDCVWEIPGCRSSAVMGKPSTTPDHLRPRLRAIADEFDSTGQVAIQSPCATPNASHSPLSM